MDYSLHKYNDNKFNQTQNYSSYSFLYNGDNEYFENIINKIEYMNNIKYLEKDVFEFDEIAISADCDSPYLKINNPKRLENYIFDKDDNNSLISFKNIIIYPGCTQTEILNNIELRNNMELLKENKEKITNELRIQKLKDDYIRNLNQELVVLNKKLKNSVPIHTIIYMSVNMFILGISLALLYLRFILKIYTVNPYYLICSTISSLGLFLTALVSIKEWKEYLTNNEI